MTKQEDDIIKQFEKDLETAMANYLASKSNILTDGEQNCYEVSNIEKGSLYLSKTDQHDLSVLLTYLEGPTNFPPALKGFVTLSIKESSEECFQNRTYFFLMQTGKYSVVEQNDVNLEAPKSFKVNIYDIAYFFEQKYRLY